MSEMQTPWLTVVGIGEDGLDGLGRLARECIAAATLLAGSTRQMQLLQINQGLPQAEYRIWPTPLLPALDEVLAQKRPGTVILASGDPMLHGIGTTIARRVALEEYRVIPATSTMALACARMGWPQADIDLVSLVSQPVDVLRRYLHDGRRIIVYSRDGSTPAAVSEILREEGFGASEVRLMANIGGSAEMTVVHCANEFPREQCPDLNVLALTLRAGKHHRSFACAPGLPDNAYDSDGQLTKHEIRAATISALGPQPGQLLWDVGAGSGSISIEWLRSHPSCRCIAFEHHSERLQFIMRNAARFGVPHLGVRSGSAPQSFSGAERPHAIFIGGGLTTPELLDTALAALLPDGRLVANAVTIESEALLVQYHARLGGNLTRLAISRAEKLGEMLCWRPMLPVTQWTFSR